MTKRPAANGALQVTTSAEVASSVPDHDPVERYLRRLMAGCQDIPLIDDLTADDLRTPCGTASIARAALRQLIDKQPEIIGEQLRQELADNDRLTIWRVRQMSGDLSEAADWSAIARRTPIAELQRLRRYEPGVAS